MEKIAAASVVETARFRVSHHVDSLLQDAAAREEELNLRRILLYDLFHDMTPAFVALGHSNAFKGKNRAGFGGKKRV